MKNNRAISRMNARELSIEEVASVAAGSLRSYNTVTDGGNNDVLTVED